MKALTKIVFSSLSAAMLLGCYAAAYLWTVRPALLDFGTGTGPAVLVPRYVVGGRVTEIFFYPANAVDRIIRTRYWQSDSLSTLLPPRLPPPRATTPPLDVPLPAGIYYVQ